MTDTKTTDTTTPTATDPVTPIASDEPKHAAEVEVEPAEQIDAVIAPTDVVRVNVPADQKDSENPHPEPSTPNADVPEQVPDSGRRTHTVAEGETLEQIADSTGVPILFLQTLNAIKKPEQIEPGMVLKLS